MRSKWQRVQDWAAGIDLIRAAIVGILGTAIGAGILFANLNNRIDNNASDIKQEAALRQADKAAVTTRLDRGFDKVLSRLDGLDAKITTNANRAADDRARFEGDLGYVKGILKSNYDNGGH